MGGENQALLAQSKADQQKEYSCCVAPAAESVDILDQQELKKT